MRRPRQLLLEPTGESLILQPRRGQDSCRQRASAAAALLRSAIDPTPTDTSIIAVSAM
jgi:hypothetical protein